LRTGPASIVAAPPRLHHEQFATLSAERSGAYDALPGRCFAARVESARRAAVAELFPFPGAPESAPRQAGRSRSWLAETRFDGRSLSRHAERPMYLFLCGDLPVRGGLSPSLAARRRVPAPTGAALLPFAFASSGARRRRALALRAAHSRPARAPRRSRRELYPSSF